MENLLLRKMLWINVFMKTLHIVTVEEDTILHGSGYEGLEGFVDHIKNPGLVNYVKCVDFHWE